MKKIALSLLSIFLLQPAFANEDTQEVIPLEEAIALQADSYSKDYGVSFEEAVRRLSLMYESSDSISEVSTEIGSDLGGLYFDNGDDFYLVVNSTKAKPNLSKVVFKSNGRKFLEKPISSRGLALGLTREKVDKVKRISEKSQNGKVKVVQKATMSKDKVLNIVRNSNSDFSQIEGFNGLLYDDKTGKLVGFIVSNANESKALSQIKKIHKDIAVRLEENDLLATNQMTRGGATLADANSPIDTGCTTGFMVRDRSTNKVGVVTAGHCDFSVARYSAPDGSRYDMTREKWAMNEKLDLAFFWSANTPTSQFHAHNDNVPRSLTGWKSVSQTRKKTPEIPGSYICHYGVASATQSCGEVVSIDFEPDAYADGKRVGCGKLDEPFLECGPNFVQVSKKVKQGEIPLQCIGGDSGGRGSLMVMLTVYIKVVLSLIQQTPQLVHIHTTHPSKELMI